MSGDIVDAKGLEKVAQAVKADAAAVEAKPDPGLEVVKLYNEVKKAQREYLKAKEQCAACKKSQVDALANEAKALDVLNAARKKLEALVDAE